ncbi:PaaI family thioesterase [Pelotomaculum isophthalicicum JI]|uniref:PaaI family thioesterase n=1 Tax=Pelotomaculum isophthalicicum JI TaxID=947010 RepID=A0A9X4JW17_9FIRM|nr:hotdog fold thioesterase [Pelotomaculum isophthalicicum]MDF9409341.1 PaaI family thioesterase [Pelotomaculum isophthalicicum JI]
MESGMERLGNDSFARHLGIKLTDMKPGYAQAMMEVKPELLNGVNITHGGAIFSLVDIVIAAASNAHGPVALALNANIHFIKATKEGAILTATAREESLTKKTGIYRVEVKDEHNNLISLAEGLAYRPSVK